MSESTYEVRMLDGTKYRIATFKNVRSVELGNSMSICFRDKDENVVGLVLLKQGDVVEKKP